MKIYNILFKKIILLTYLTLILLVNSAMANSNKISVTIKPLYSLVKAVVGDKNEVVLLVDDSSSPHNFALKPSDIENLNNSDAIFFIDKNIEGFLHKALKNVPDRVVKFEIGQISGLNILSSRSRKGFEGHHHHHSHKSEDHHNHKRHDHSGADMHIWLDIDNSKIIVKFIAKKLAEIYPQNKDFYMKNVEKTLLKIDELDRKLVTILKNSQNKNFMVFHDAYQYFEKRYGLTAVGSIMVDPTRPISARRAYKIRKMIKKKQAICIFYEPQFSDKTVKSITTELNIDSNILDPIGFGLKNDENLYFNLMENIAKNFAECLNNSELKNL